MGQTLRPDGVAIEAEPRPTAFAARVTKAAEKGLALDPDDLRPGRHGSRARRRRACAPADLRRRRGQLGDDGGSRQDALGASGRARADGDLGALADLTDQIAKQGVEDLVLDPGARSWADSLSALTRLRRAAIKKNFKPLGYPVIAFTGEARTSPEEEAMLASQFIGKYAGFIVLDHFEPAAIYSLLTLRQNIYTDPQKPIQVSPGLYEIGEPEPESPLLVTTNFSLTYFSVAGEVEGSGRPAWLLVADSEGMSVLTAWAAGKFDADAHRQGGQVDGGRGQDNASRIIIPGAGGRPLRRARGRAARLAGAGRPAGVHRHPLVSQAGGESADAQDAPTRHAEAGDGRPGGRSAGACRADRARCPRARCLKTPSPRPGCGCRCRAAARDVAAVALWRCAKARCDGGRPCG